MITEIKTVEINENEIILEGINLESIFTADDLFKDLEEEMVRFVFNYREHGGGCLKYLYKVCASQNRCKNAKSIGEKIEKLVGSIVFLSDNFRVY